MRHVFFLREVKKNYFWQELPICPRFPLKVARERKRDEAAEADAASHMPPSTTSSEEKKRFVRRLAKAFGTCTEESRQYGLCLKSYLEGVERGACSAQFEALSRCFKKGLRAAK